MNSTQNRWTFWQRVLRLVLRYPGQFLNHLNAKNFRILLYALRHEPPSLIISNLRHLILYGSKRSKLSTKKKEILFYEESCRRYPDKLEIMGWAITKSGLKHFAFYQNNRLVKKPVYGFHRPDLAQQYPEYPEAETGGFLLLIPWTADEGELFALLEDATGNQLKVPIEIPPAVSGTSALTSQKQDRLSWRAHRRLQRRQRKLRFRASFCVTIIESSPVPDGPGAIHHTLDSLKRQVYEPEKIAILRLNDSGSIPEIHLDKVQSFNQVEDWKQAIHQYNSDYLLFCQAGDAWREDALLQMAVTLDRLSARPDILYFDHAYRKEAGQTGIPHFKPEFNPDLLRSFDYIGPAFAVRKETGDKLHWLDTGFSYAATYDLLLRAVHHEASFMRIPELLLTRPAGNGSEDPDKNREQVAALKRHLEQSTIPGEVLPGLTDGTYRIKRHIAEPRKVSILIPFRDRPDLLKTCVSSILKKTEYPDYEILLLSNNSREAATYEYLEELSRQHEHIRWMRFDEPFNYARINNFGAAQAKGDYLLLLNNDTEVLDPGWLSAMVEHIQREEVGAVGAKLLYPDRSVQHAGIILNIGGAAEHAHKHFPDNHPGYFGRAQVIQNFSACTAACLLTKKEVYQAVGGLDEENLPIAFNDVDLCLEIRKRGLLIVYTPYARLLHYESISRGLENTPEKRVRAGREIRFFRKKWKSWLEMGDPYYHPAFSLRRGDFSIAEME